MSDVNRQWLLDNRPSGMVEPSNFDLRQAERPVPGDGEMLVRNLYLSLDPAMRTWMIDAPSYIPPVAVGEVMRGACLASVVESNKEGFEPGDLVIGIFGWQDYADLRRRRADAGDKGARGRAADDAAGGARPDQPDRLLRPEGDRQAPARRDVRRLGRGRRDRLGRGPARQDRRLPRDRYRRRAREVRLADRRARLRRRDRLQERGHQEADEGAVPGRSRHLLGQRRRRRARGGARQPRLPRPDRALRGDLQLQHARRQGARATT